MKTFRIVLTVLIFFSLKSILLCSAAGDQAGMIQEQPRKPSFDAPRDSNLFTKQARINYALNHDGTTCTHWGRKYEVRPGSDSGAQARWEQIGRTQITTVTNAEKFLSLVARNKLSLSQKALAPAQQLIQDSLINNAIMLDEIDRLCGYPPTHVTRLALKPKSLDELVKELENARSGEESDDSTD